MLEAAVVAWAGAALEAPLTEKPPVTPAARDWPWGAEAPVAPVTFMRDDSEA